MDISRAFKALDRGRRITNSGWNGANQYVFKMPGYPEGVEANDVLAKAANIPAGYTVIISPYYMLKNPNGVFSVWVPSNGDIHSKNWKIYE